MLTTSDEVLNIISENELSVEDTRLFAKLLSGKLEGFYNHIEPKLVATREKRSHRKSSTRKDVDSYSPSSVPAEGNIDATTSNMNTATNEDLRQY